MSHPATTALRWLYCLAVLAAIIPFGTSGWVAATLGGGMVMTVPFLTPLVLLVTGLWRIYLVATQPMRLDSYRIEGVLKFMRVVGLIAMSIGVAYLVLQFASRPLMKALVTSPSESGVEFYVVGVYLALLGGVGPLGILLFEMSRLFGLEKHVADGTATK